MTILKYYSKSLLIMGSVIQYQAIFKDFINLTILHVYKASKTYFLTQQNKSYEKVISKQIQKVILQIMNFESCELAIHHQLLPLKY